ncbi:MAG: hypothetical protein ACFB10_11830 [Salibacteraceae bacterium]
MKKFDLWLEFEETEGWEDLTNDFANIQVSLPDGRKYGINVWTFNFLTEVQKSESSIYILPPDLFVAELTRKCIDQTVSQLLEIGDLEQVLNPTVFSLNFLAPWEDTMLTHDLGEALEMELTKELHPTHPLYNSQFEIQAKRQDKDDILIEIVGGGLAVVHLTWSGKEERGIFPSTTFYRTPEDFWKRALKKDIIDWQ